jgi:FkbM family methyltransferase
MIGKVVRRLRRALFPTDYERMTDRWFADNGDRTLRLNYDLDNSSTVFDLGGYEGQWASDIFAMYRSHIYVFEPVHAHAQEISRRFTRNPLVECFAFGLAGTDREEEVALDADGSSLFRTTGQTETIRLVEAARFIREHGIKQINLMKVNIEGGEYELLEHFLDAGLMALVDNLQVQFHDYVPNARQRMELIRQRLGSTHEPTWQYEFVWENWRRSEGQR